MLERISKITERWFLSEEALFSVFFTHRVAENSGMECHVRVGKGVIEVNPDLCADITDKELEERLRIEVIRILLTQPYDRQPDGCCITARALGSNCVIGDSYRLQKVEIEKPSDFKLPSNGHYEFYARCIQKILQKSGGQGQNNDNSEDNPQLQGEGNDGGFGKEYTDIAQNWQQDELMAAQVNEVIRDVKSWGSLPGGLVEEIVASTKARVDYRKILAGFRASILSQKRKLTRMRPNRRTGFENMGSIRRFDTKLLIAVDVSGSISSQSLSYFYGVINSAFRYGFESIDVIQFDCGVRVVQSLKKVMRDVAVIGRGGTSFQEPIEYAHENGYDGLVILTDGYAPEPWLPDNMRCKIIWVCQDSSCYERHHRWMEKSGRVCTIELS